MRVKTTVAQVSIEGGERHDRPGGTLVDEHSSRPGKGRDRGNLYVLMEVSGQPAGRDIIADQLVQVIHKAYFGRPGSVTAGLQNAIREANKLLFDDNQESLPGDRRTAGVSCVVLRASSRRSQGNDEDLFIAQAGPAAVYLAQGGQVTRFPDISPWLDGMPPEEMDAAALGQRRDLNVALFHTQVSGNDTILLAESGIAGWVPSEGWNSILTEETPEAIVDALAEAGQGNRLSALVVQLGDRQAGQVAEQPTGPVEARRVPQATALPIGDWVPQGLGDRVSQGLGQIRLGERMQSAGRALAATFSGIGGVLLTLLRRVVPGQASSQGARGSQNAIVYESQKPAKRRRKDRAKDQAPSDMVQKILTGLAIAIPLVVAAIVLITYLQRGQVRQEELKTLWLEADSRWQTAIQTTDQAQVRTLLTEADGYIDQLLERKPEHAEAIDLRQRIQVLLDELNSVQRISWIGDLKTYPGNANLTRVVVEGVHIFVMDRRAGKVYHHQLDEFQQSLKADSLDVVLVSKGNQVGNTLVNDLVDMVWMPVGNDRQSANLLILESGGALLEYDPATGELAALEVAATELWQYPKLVGSYYGRFYLLDPTANQIWRYPPTLDGYSLPPEEWLQTEVDLAGVVDMAIGNSIYLLYADGSIKKLTGGSPDAFDISDWDKPPQNPAAFFTRPPEETQWVYVADRGNSRIVQCGKEGQFKRQFRLADSQVTGGSDPMAGVTGLFVDEIGGQAYFLSGQKLYMIILPD